MVEETTENSTSDTSSVSTSEKVILGRITGVYGVKGWVKVFSHTEPMEAIVDYSPWYIRAEGRNNAPWNKVKLKSGKRQAKTVIAKLEHCNDRDQALAYIGTEIAIDLQQLEQLKKENEYYWRDLIGLRVINLQDIELGVVKSLLETGANDVLVVDETGTDQTGSDQSGTDQSGSHQTREHLIPWTMGMAIIKVDTEQGVITVDWDADF